MGQPVPRNSLLRLAYLFTITTSCWGTGPVEGFGGRTRLPSERLCKIEVDSHPLALRGRRRMASSFETFARGLAVRALSKMSPSTRKQSC